MKFKLEFERWEDGEKVKKTLTSPDRWEVHSAENVLVSIDHLHINVKQQPKSITARKMGVGACLWDGALFLAAYILVQPQYKFVGSRCIELGAGVGFVSVVLARLGANVITTDIQKVLPLLQENMEVNNVIKSPSSENGWAEVEELEWGKEGWMHAVRLLSEPAIDYVFAADCCYIDNDGTSPSTPAFVETCRGLCGPQTRVLVAFERRSLEVRRCLIDEAKKVFGRVKMISLNQLPKELRLEYCDLWEFRL